MDEDRALASFAALSNSTRLRMLKALVAAGPSGMTAGAVAAEVAATPSRASFHLAALAEAGLVAAERAARQVTYRVEFNAVGALIRYLIEDCCRNDAELVACCAPRLAQRKG